MFKNRECTSVEELLWKYSAGRLTGEEQARVELHLYGCSECRAELEGYRVTRAALKQYREVPVPHSSKNWQDLRERLEASQQRQSFPAVRRGLLFTWGVVAMAAFAGFLFLQRPISDGRVSEQIGSPRVRTVVVGSTSVGPSTAPVFHVPAAGRRNGLAHLERDTHRVTVLHPVERRLLVVAVTHPDPHAHFRADRRELVSPSVPHVSRVRTGRVRTVATVDYGSLDGGRQSSDSHVINLTPAVAAADGESTRLGSIASATSLPRRISSAIISDEIEEAHAW